MTAAEPTTNTVSIPILTQEPFPDTPGSAEPEWFKTAVFYEVLVRSFKDSDGDGTGDFRGLIDKLDYLEWLGVDCLWLPCATAGTTSRITPAFNRAWERPRTSRRSSTPPTSAACASSSTSS